MTSDDRSTPTPRDGTGKPQTRREVRLEQRRQRRSQRSALSNLLAVLKEVAIVVSLAVVLSLLVKTFLVQPFHIPSGSMENTLVKDDRVVVSKLTPGPFDVQRGDVIVFTDPAHWLGNPPPKQRSPLQSALIFLGLAPDDSDDHLVKRVIGLPGDHVQCCSVDGRIIVNGAAISEPYVKVGDTPDGGRPAFDIHVPEGHVWVMGDHRSDSADSRVHDDGTGSTGSVPLSAVQGKAIAIVWPMSRWSVISTPSEVFSAVPRPTATTR
jgi:signal peptidase I